MSQPIPVWRGVVDTDGKLQIDGLDLFRRYIARLKGQGVTLTLRKATRPKSRSQLGYLWGIVYPVIAESLGYKDYEIDALHDALMQKLCGLKPDPNPLNLRVSLATMSHEEVSGYIEDVRFFALTELNIVTPDAHKGGAGAGEETADSIERNRMAKQSHIDKAIQNLEGEIAVLQLAIAKLKAQQGKAPAHVSPACATPRAPHQPRIVAKEQVG